MNETSRFFHEEDGAVTVDWVVLTAAVVGLGLLVLIPVFTGTSGAADVVSNEIVKAVNLP